MGHTKLKLLQQKTTDFQSSVKLAISVGSVSCICSGDRLLSSENVKGVSISMQNELSIAACFCKNAVARKQRMLAA